MWDLDFMDINQLPDECLLRIFSFLNPLEISESVVGVSERWKTIGSDPYLNNHLFIHVLKIKNNKMQREYYMKILEESATVKNITYDVDVKYTSNILMNKITTECLMLETLRAPRFRMTKYYFQNLVQNCSFIRRLELKSSSPETLEMVINLPLLESLRFSQPIRANPPVISLMRNLATLCNNFNELFFPYVQLPNEDFIFILDKMKDRLKILAIQTDEHIDKEIFKLLSECRLLEELRLQSLSLARIDMNKMQCLMKLPKLKILSLKYYSLHFSKNYCYNNFSIYSFLNLSSLELIECYVNYDFLWFITNYMSKITSLLIDNVSDIRDEDLPILLKGLSRLKNLHLADLEHVTLAPFESCRSFLGSLRKLRFEDCPAVDDAMLFEWEKDFLSDVEIIPNSVNLFDMNKLFDETDTS